MSEKKNVQELNLNEVEKVSGGIVHRICRHQNKSLTGESKTVNGVVYFQLKCDNCGELFWEKGSDLIAPATVN